MGTEVEITLSMEQTLIDTDTADVAILVERALRSYGAYGALVRITSNTPVEVTYDTPDGPRTVLRYPNGAEIQIGGPPAPGRPEDRAPERPEPPAPAPEPAPPARQPIVDDGSEPMTPVEPGQP